MVMGGTRVRWLGRRVAMRIVRARPSGPAARPGDRCPGRSIIKPFGTFPHDTAADEAFNGAQLRVVFGGHETDGIAHRVSAAGSAYTVDIILGVHRKIVIDHVGDVVHINPARGDIGGHENAHGAGLEVFQGAQALVLRAVGMQRGCLHPLALELFRQPVRSVLHPREDQDHVQL